MATIGKFTKKDGGYSGDIQTLGFKVKVAITPVEQPTEKGPDFRVYTGKLEIGAGWVKTAKNSKRDYISLKIDDPTLAAPLYANLVERDDQFDLLWSR